MALSQTIVWTTLPNGRVTLNRGQPMLRVSVFVSPRLTPTAKAELRPFDLFLRWPEIVESLRFKLVFDGGATGALTPLPGEDPLDVTLWQRLFDRDTFVRGHAFTDLQNETIRSFPAADVASYVQDLYGVTAEKHGDDFPKYGDDDDSPLTKLKQDLAMLLDPAVRSRLDKSLDAMLGKTKVLPPIPPRGAFLGSAATYAFYQASRFYNRPKVAGSNDYRASPDPAFTPEPVVTPEFDFHQAITALADYPRLLRRLGLVLDFGWIEPVAVAAQGRVRVEIEWGTPDPRPAFHVEAQTPWTAYSLSAGDFRARAAAGVDNELTRGQLDLSAVRDERPDAKTKTAYVIAQVDVDGSALKAVHTAGTLARMESTDMANYRTPQTSDLPALRTASLALYKRQRAAATHAQLIRAAQVQSQFGPATRPAFNADDLLRGYRIDVWDDASEEWHSLCLRNGEYRFTRRGKLELALRDEGYVKSSSATRSDDGTPTDLYLHERLAGFDGWSLVASRPGRTLAPDPADAEPIVAKEDAATSFGLATRFAPPAGTLPRLRFGRSYRLRVRIVDLAGNSVAFDTAGDASASQPFLYSRYEPIPSPALLLRARVTEGESLEHLVIRSDYDRTAEAYAVDPVVVDVLEAVRDRLELKGKDRDGYLYLGSNERHIAPPKTSQLEAEMHGRFDDYLGPGKDHAKGRRLAARESATFLSTTMVNLDTGMDEPIPGLNLDTVPPAGKKRTNLGDPSRQPGDPLQDGEYVLHREAQLTVPYLPDPYAAGVAFLGLPGMPAGEPYIHWFKGDWPNVHPFRLRLVERSGVLNQCAQVFADSGAPVWDEVENVLIVAQPKGVTTDVRYSSVLPSAADARNMGLWKWLEQRGGLSADMRKQILSGRHWMFTPWRTLTLVHAVQHPLCPPTIRTFEASRYLGETHADLAGKWTLSIKSTAKVDVQASWQEPLDDPALPDWHVLERSGLAAEMKMNPAYTDELDVPPLMNPLIVRVRLPLRHEFGDTKHRVVQYRLKGTTRFREYFPVELTQHDEAITRSGEKFTVSVPSSARPVSPRPLYILPTFQWEETKLADGGMVRTRRGNGLRVYLERPWWSSGESERLGVVFKTGTIEENGPFKPYVTQWGLDPVFDSPAPVAGPTMAAFPLAVDTRSNVSVAEIGDQLDVLAVAGHAVEFDPTRKLWYSDIVVKAGASYFPFIRLALARFQPFSIEDCHLSRVVLMDFVQLVPDRTLDVRWIGPNRVRVKIFGTAPTETFVSRVLPSLMQVRTQAQAQSRSAPVKDLVSETLTGEKVRQAFHAGALESLRETSSGVFRPKPVIQAEPAEASKRSGLNEYSVTVEKLPDGGSEDFDWIAIDGVTVTKPPAPGSGGAMTPIDPRLFAKNTPRVGKSASAQRKSSSSAAAKVGRAREIGDVFNPGELLANTPSFQIAPLWEGDVTLPPLNDQRPRRLVVRENELFFKATPQPKEFLPIARRLVYVDIVALPAPVA